MEDELKADRLPRGETYRNSPMFPDLPVFQPKIL